MLSPDALEEAGEELARVYRGIEAEMLDYLARLMLSGGGVTSRSATAAALLGQTHAGELRRIIASHAAEVDAELRATVERHLRASDADDMERIGRPGTEKAWPRQMEATLRGLAAILERDNLGMERGAVEAFLKASTAAIAKVNAGAETAERALHAAVRQLERDGVRIVQYADANGNATVANRADVAVRRHVRTQIAQDGARMTADAMDRYGVQLVEVSSHPNARPTHASWQGQVYGWRGTVTVDGRTYDGLEAATGYGSVDGLLGANCRHSFGPYLPGARRAYSRDPKHASGLPGEQVYALEQRQRAGERAIREAKRELSGARICHDAAPTLAARAEVVKAQELLARRQDAMRRLVAESNALSVTGRPVLHRHPAREWAGDIAGGVRIASSGRKVDELLAGKAAQAAMARAGVSKTAVKRAIADEMRRQGMEPPDFSTLTAGEQRRTLNAIMPGVTPMKAGRRQFRKIGGEHTASQDLAAVNPSYATMEPRWTRNCQRCVPAYEMRRRGYDVVVKPRLVDESGKLVGAKGDPVYAGWASIFENARFEPCNGTGRARCDTLMRRWGDGARAEVYVNWAKGDAHVFVAENRNGKVVYIDPQNGVEDASGYFKKAKRNCTMIARIDNLNPSKLIDGCCTSRKGAEQ